MSIKLKVLGLGLLAVLATSAFAVVNASATSTGHFTAEPPTDHLIVKGTEAAGSEHQLTFYEINSKHETVDPDNRIECTHAHYHGTLTGPAATTTSSVQVRPEYTECRTSNHAEGTHPVTVDVDPNNTGCETDVFDFTSGGTGTVHVNCHILITHPQCGITIHPQTLSGVTYTTIETNGKHALTLHVNVKTIAGTYESGICIFLGTNNHFFEMVGSATVWGEDTAKNPVHVTHTTP